MEGAWQDLSYHKTEIIFVPALLDWFIFVGNIFLS